MLSKTLENSPSLSSYDIFFINFEKKIEFLVLVLVYTQEGSLWSIVLRCDDHTGIFTCDMVAPGTRTFMCPPRHRDM